MGCGAGSVKAQDVVLQVADRRGRGQLYGEDWRKCWDNQLRAPSLLHTFQSVRKGEDISFCV